MHVLHPQHLEQVRTQNLSVKHPMCTCLQKAASSVVPPSPVSHSLLYNMTVLSRDGFVQSRFFAEGYLDRQAFLHYDHKKGRAEPWGRWADKLAAETWETETTDLNATWKELRKLLAEILSLQEEKGDDSGEGGKSAMGHFPGRSATQSVGLFPLNLGVGVRKWGL